jgi:bifunctional non-homologous end joining protein LigD
MAKSVPRAGKNDTVEIEGVRVTNPDRVLFPGQGVAKLDLIDHYLSVADRMLPHVRNRPLSLVRCPQGRTKECFYQKHASDGFPAAFREIEIAEKSGRDRYLYIEDKAGLVAAVQMGVLELHVWGARADRIERPDRLVFDFDPDEEIPFSRVKDGASEMRERLDELGLVSFLLATGGKGLHVVVPFARRHGWDAHKDFAEAMACSMTRDAPERYTATLSKASRRGKVFIDYLRNGRGATAIAPFSSRARAHAPVAFPLPWSALGRLKDSRSVTVADAAARHARYKADPWQGYFELRQLLPELGR